MTKTKRDKQAVVRGDADVEYATAPDATGRSDGELQRVRALVLAALNRPTRAKLTTLRLQPTSTEPTATATERPTTRTSAAAARAERHVRRTHR